MIQFIKSGDMAGFKGRSKYAWLIGLNTFSDWSHFGIFVWVKFDENESRLFILEAVAKYGVRLISFEDAAAGCQVSGEKIYWFKLDPLHDLNRPILVDYASRQLGKRYASPAQMVFSFGWLTRFIRYLCGRPAADLDPNRFFCSELGAAALQAIGVRTRKIPAEMSPADLAEEPALLCQGVINHGPQKIT